MQITIDTLSWFDKLTMILSYLKGHPELVEGWSGREDLNFVPSPQTALFSRSYKNKEPLFTVCSQFHLKNYSR